MTPLYQQRFNTVVGGVLIGLGVLAWATAVFFAVVPNAPAPAPVINTPIVDLQSCRSALVSLGLRATVRNQVEVVVQEDISAQFEEQLERASLASVVCKLPMQSFCMGAGCTPAPGMHMVLSHPKDDTVAASARNNKPAAAPAAKPATTAKP